MGGGKRTQRPSVRTLLRVRQGHQAWVQGSNRSDSGSGRTVILQEWGSLWRWGGEPTVSPNREAVKTGIQEVMSEA